MLSRWWLGRGLIGGIACQVALVSAAHAAQWERVSAGPSESRFVAVAVDPGDAAHVLAASARAVYESTDDGRTWHERFRVPAESAIAALALGADKPATILVATDRGLYGSFDGGQQWSLAFRGVGEGQASCTHVGFHPSLAQTALVGTRDGLFLSRDRGQHWEPVILPADARQVIHVAWDPAASDRVFVLTTRGLFIGPLPSGPWQQRSAVVRPVEERSEAPDAAAAEEPDAPPLELRAVAVHPRQPSTLYVATSRGLRVSEDGGASWRWMSQTGLLSPDMARVMLQAHSPVALYAATAHGIARFRDESDRWEALTAGLADAPAHDIAGTAYRLWAATDEGLFRFEVTPDPFCAPEPLDAPGLLGNFVHEPTIGQVRDAAIRYAEVHPDKIQHWRRQAALKALLPNVNVGLDHGTSQNTHVDEGSFPHFQLLDTTDRDAGLKMSVTWELGNLIWNEDQTAIDTRSKLMVQLRDDLVNEVIRTYFERRRLQVALLIDPPAEQRALLEKELRVQELTALLDGLTGGYFSTHMAAPANKGRL